MPGDEPQMSGTQPDAENQPSEQTQGAVELNDMSRTEARDEEAGPTLPAKDGPSSSGAAAETAGSGAGPSTKGKAKEERPGQTEKPKEDDSLSIEPTSPVKSAHSDSLVCAITLLLPTGARHPYKIDEKYLTKRGVEIPDETSAGKKDPFSISVYKLKELILREWREDWEAKPASPTSIRLIHFGKLLEDKEQLKKYNFSADTPNVVHMSVRPAEMVEEDEAGKSKSGGRETRSQRGGGCCVIL